MAFFYTSPLMQYFLNKDEKEEFHIKLRSNVTRTQSYYDNTGKYLWAEVKKFMTTNWKSEIHEIGIDHSDESMSEFIWIHISLDTEKKMIIQIVNRLNTFFDNEIRKHLVPKLVTIICNGFKSSERFLAESLCEYQEKHGKERTKEWIEIYFRDIKTSQLYGRLDLSDLYDSD